MSRIKVELVSGSGDSPESSSSMVGVVCRRVRSAGDGECHRLTSLPLTLHRLRVETLQFRQNPSFSSFSVTASYLQLLLYSK